MAKKEKIDLDRFDDFDLEDNWGMDPLPGVSETKNDRNPVKKAGTTALRELGKTTFTKQMATAIMKEALPRSFTTTLTNADNGLTSARAFYADVRKDAQPLVREMKALGRTLGRFAPTKYQEKINKFLRSNDDRSGSQLSQINLEDIAALKGVNDIFGDDKESKQDAVEEITAKLTDQEYRLKLGTSIGAIQNLLARQVSYQMGVQRAFQKKSMELQIRQLMISRSQLDVTQKAAIETSNLLRSIVANTALPEAVKQQKSEEFSRMARDKLFGRVQDEMYSWTAGYRNRIKERAANLFRDKFDKFKTGIQFANDGIEQLEQQRDFLASLGLSPEDILAQEAGKGTALAIGRRVGRFIKKRSPGLRRTDGVFQGINYLFNNKERLASDWGNSGYKYGGIRDSITNTVKDILRDSYKDGGIVRDNRLGVGQKDLSIEDRKLSFMEEQTGYLSRILHSIDILRTGNDKIERTVYNRQKGVFTTFSESQATTRQALLKDKDIQGQQESVERLLSSIDPSGRIVGDARTTILNYLMSRARTSKAFNPAQLANEKIPGLQRDDHRLWQGLLAKRYGLKLNEKSEWSLNPFSSSNVNLNIDAGQYNYASTQTQSLFNKAHGLAATGNLEELIAEGAVVFKDGNWELNKDYYGNRVNGLRSGQPPIPPAQNRNGPSPIPPIPPGFGGNQDLGNLNRFGSNWNNPNSVNFNLNRDSEADRFRKAITEQTDIIVDKMTKNQMFFETILPEIQYDISGLPPLLQKILEEGEINPGGGGGDNSGRRGRRRKWYNLSVKNALRTGLRGAALTARSAWNVSALPFTAAKKVFDRVKAPGLRGLKRLTDFGLGKAFSLGSQALEMAQDGYIRTSTGIKKVIEKSGLEAGRYVDQNTGKAIYKLSDIKGAVWDVVAGTQVISEDEVKDGIFTGDGKRVKTLLNRTLGAVGSLFTGRFTPYNLVKQTLRGAGKTLGFFLNRLPDVYVVGETKPRLYAAKLARGEYYSMRTGKRIKSLSDIDGDVGTLDPVTRSMNLVLSAEDAAKGLVDKRGGRIRTGLSKLLSMGGNALRGIGNFAMAPLRLLNAMGGATSKLITGGLRTAGRFLGRGLGLNIGGGSGESSWTKRIYRLLVNQFTGRNPLEGLDDDVEGGGILNWLKRGRRRIAGNANDAIGRLKDRAGSWWNRLHDGKGKPPKPEDAEKAAKSSGGWGKMIWGALAGVGGLIGKLVSGFGNFWGWIRKLPQWIMGAKAANAAGDLAGDVLGGGRKGGLLRKTGRFLGKAGRGLLTAAGFLGRGALSAGGLLARGAVTGASMLGGVLSAPVVLTAAAVAGAGYLIYKGYQAYKGRMTDLRKYRVAQYGVNPDDEDKGAKLLALEEAVLKESRVDGSGKLKIGSLPFQDLIKGFDIDIIDQRNVLRWMRWYRMRFVPVFTKNVELLNRMDSKAKLTDADFLKDSQKPDFARGTFIASGGTQSPYLVSDSPFANAASITGDDFVAKYRDVIVAKFRKNEEAATRSGERKVAVDSEVKKPNTTVDVINKKVAERNTTINPTTDLYYSPGDTIKQGTTLTGDSRRDELIQIGNRIDDITAIRMKLYGLGQLVKDDVNNLIALENDVIKFIRYADKGVATFTGDIGEFFNRWNGTFTINANNKTEKEQWIFWFRNRFLPVFLNFCSESNFLSPNASPMTAWKRLNASDLLKIANFMNQATTVVDNVKTSVWAIKAAPWPNRVSNLDASVIQTNLDALRTASKKEVYAEKVRTEKEIKEMTFDGKALRSTTTGSKIADLMTDMSAVTATSKGRASGPNGIGSYGQNYGSSGTSFERAGTGDDYIDVNISHIGEGTGGSINDLPIPKGDGWENNRDMIVAAAKMAGIDAGTLAAMIGQESDYKLNSANSKSSAKGLGQFLDGTWKEILPILVKKYGVNPKTPSTDPRASVLATAEYMKQNAKQVGDIGRPWTTTDFYMAHFLGAGDAKKVLTVPTNTSLQQALGARYSILYKANPSIFEGLKTTGDLYRVMGGLMAKKGGQYGDKARALSNQMGIPTTETGPVPDNGTETTPPIPKVPTALSKGDMPIGDKSNVSMYSDLGTDSTPAVSTGTSDDRDKIAVGQQALQTESQRIANRKAIAEKRARAQANAETTGTWMETLNQQLEVQRSMDSKLGEIVGLIKGDGTNKTSSPKETVNSKTLKEESGGFSTRQSAGKSVTPFNPTINPEFHY